MDCQTFSSQQSFVQRDFDEKKEKSTDTKNVKTVSVSKLAPRIVAWFAAPKFDPSQAKSTQPKLSDAELKNLLQKLPQLSEGHERDKLMYDAKRVEYLKIDEGAAKSLVKLLPFFPNLRRLEWIASDALGSLGSLPTHAREIWLQNMRLDSTHLQQLKCYTTLRHLNLKNVDLQNGTKSDLPASLFAIELDSCDISTDCSFQGIHVKRDISGPQELILPEKDTGDCLNFLPSSIRIVDLSLCEPEFVNVVTFLNNYPQCSLRLRFSQFKNWLETITMFDAAKGKIAKRISVLYVQPEQLRVRDEELISALFAHAEKKKMPNSA